MARAADVQNMDPVRVVDTESIEVGTLLFEGLVRWTPGTTDIEPGLARSWETSPDGLVWTFHLQPGVAFQDGGRVDADAVVFSFDRLRNPVHPAYLAGDDADYWRRVLEVVDRTTVIDPGTVEIRVKRPYAPLLSYLALFPIVSPAAVTRWGDSFKDNPIGAGPFQLEEWRTGDTLVLRRFDAYWGPRPVFERLVFRVVADARQRLVELESGSVDLAMSILPEEQSFVALHPELALHQKQSDDITYLAFNLRKQPFEDVAVRRAVAHAVNKVPIVKLAFQGRARAAESPLPPTVWGHYEPDQPRYPFDPERARALLQTAIAAHKFDPEATYTLYAPSTPRPYMASPERVARYLAAALGNIGIKIELRLLPYSQHRTAVQAGEHDLALFGWQSDTGDPDNLLWVLFHSDNAAEGSANNIAFFRDAEVDRLLIAAQGVTDRPARARLYRGVQERIGELVPWVPIAHSEYVVAARKEIVNVVLSPLGHPDYSRIAREGHK